MAEIGTDALVADLVTRAENLEQTWFDLRAAALQAATRWQHGRGTASTLGEYIPHWHQWHNVPRLRPGTTPVEHSDGYAKAWDEAGRLVLVLATPAARWMRTEAVCVHDPADGDVTEFHVSTVPDERWLGRHHLLVRRFGWRGAHLAFVVSAAVDRTRPGARPAWSREDFTWRDGSVVSASLVSAEGIVRETAFFRDRKGLARITTRWPPHGRRKHEQTTMEFLRSDLRPDRDAAWRAAESAVLPAIWRAASGLAAGRPIHHLALVYGSGAAQGTLPPGVFVDVVGGKPPQRHLFPEYGLHASLDGPEVAAGCADLNILDLSRPGVLSRRFTVELARRINAEGAPAGCAALTLAPDFLCYASDPEGDHLRQNLKRMRAAPQP